MGNGSLTPNTYYSIYVEQTILKGKRCFQCKVSQCFEVLQIYYLLLLKEKIKFSKQIKRI